MSMITKESIAAWVADNNTLLLLSVPLIIGATFFELTIGKHSARVAEQYEASHLVGRVDTVLSYSRGMPKVQLSTGEKAIIYLPAAGQEYLQGKDSLVKESGNEIVTVYRQFPEYTEVSVFGGDDDSTDAEGLAKRYRIARKP